MPFGAVSSRAPPANGLGLEAEQPDDARRQGGAALQPDAKAMAGQRGDGRIVRRKDRIQPEAERLDVIGEVRRQVPGWQAHLGGSARCPGRSWSTHCHENAAKGRSRTRIARDRIPPDAQPLSLAASFSRSRRSPLSPHQPAALARPRRAPAEQTGAGLRRATSPNLDRCSPIACHPDERPRKTGRPGRARRPLDLRRQRRPRAGRRRRRRRAHRRRRSSPFTGSSCSMSRRHR